jgi:hypothetical protein
VQWAEDAALQELIEWLPGRDFGDSRQNIYAPTVFPDLARLVRKRELAETRDEFPRVVLRVNRALAPYSR